MAFYYFDASALVKYYVTEPGSTWVRHLVEDRDSETEWVHTIFVAEITRVEVAAGLAVIERIGRIRRAQRDREYRRFVSQFVSRYAVIPLVTADLEYAADLTQQYPLIDLRFFKVTITTPSRYIGSRKATRQSPFPFVPAKR
jgi:predicted nucleic acid-binding protein